MTGAAADRGVLTDEHVEDYREKGYFVVEGLYDEYVDDIIETIVEIAENPDDYPAPVTRGMVDEGELPEGMEDLEPVDRVSALRPNIPEFEPYYDTGASPAARIAAAVLGHQELRRIYKFCFCNPPGIGSGVPWHQDQALWSQWMPESVTCWVALSEVTPENGCLQFVPGSHERGIVPHVPAEDTHPHVPDSEIDEDDIEYAVMDPGDAVLFDPLVFHQSGANDTDRRRLSTAAVYTSAGEWEEAKRNAEWVQYRYDVGDEVGMTFSSPWDPDEHTWPHVHVDR